MAEDGRDWQETGMELKREETIKGWHEAGSCAIRSSGRITKTGGQEGNGGFAGTVLVGAKLAYHGWRQ